jgi:hypothetical protein
MANPYHHAKSSARQFGGVWEDYIAIHSWFDESKAIIADARHRALRHHAEGIFQCERLFGVVIKRASDGKEVPTRWVGEQHVLEDFGFIPTAAKWLELLPIESWMMRGSRKLSKEMEECGNAKSA